MKSAVIYARYSSYGQTEQSIEGQLRVCHEFAKREGYKIIEEYIDRAKTGTKDNRPEFQRMIKDSGNKIFEFVIVYQFDRFARNRRDSINYKYTLRKNGCRVISATEPSSDTPENIIIEGFFEDIAEYYSADLSQKAKRGIRESVLKKQTIGGRALYGYKVIDKKIVIDEERAKVMQYYFAERASGKPRKQIVDELRAKGIPSQNGKQLSYNSFQNAEKNRKYIGEFNFHGEIFNDIYPPIIDKETFMKVQKIKTRLKHSNRAKIDYILTGKLFCGHCGSPMVGVSGTSRHGTTHSYYACSKSYKKHTCDKKNEKKEFIERYVCEQTIKYISNPDRIKFLADRLMEVYENDLSSQRVKFFEKEIASLNKQLDKLTDEYIGAPKLIKERITEKVSIIEKQLEDVKNELQKAKIVQGMKITKESLIVWLQSFSDGNIDDEAFRKRIVDLFINAVYLYDDKINIYFNAKDSEQVSYFEMQEDNNQIEEEKSSSGVLMENPTPRHLKIYEL